MPRDPEPAAASPSPRTISLFQTLGIVVLWTVFWASSAILALGGYAGGVRAKA